MAWQSFSPSQRVDRLAGRDGRLDFLQPVEHRGCASDPELAELSFSVVAVPAAHLPAVLVAVGGISTVVEKIGHSQVERGQHIRRGAARETPQQSLALDLGD